MKICIQKYLETYFYLYYLLFGAASIGNSVPRKVPASSSFCQRRIIYSLSASAVASTAICRVLDLIGLIWCVFGSWFVMCCGLSGSNDLLDCKFIVFFFPWFRSVIPGIGGWFVALSGWECIKAPAFVGSSACNGCAMSVRIWLNNPLWI